MAVAELPAPLNAGAYHVVAAETGKGPAAATQFRVLPFFYPRTSFHVPAELCNQMHMNLAMSWKPLEACREYDIHTTSIWSEDRFSDLHERVAYAVGPDEPDAHDHRGGTYATGLGYHARLLSDGGWHERLERFAPHVSSSWLIMNNELSVNLICPNTINIPNLQ